MHKIVLTITLFCSFSLGFAQEIGYPIIRNYLPEEFLFSPQVYSLIQDKRGVMYFGITDYGVIEYDGAEWRGIPNNNKSEVYSFATDTSGQIYLSSTNDFGYLKVNPHGKTVYRSLKYLLPDSTLNVGSVWNVNIIGNTAYFFTEKNIFCYSIKENRIKTIFPKTGTSFYVPFVFHNEYYVLHSSDGIFKLLGETFVPLPNTSFFSKNNFLTVLEYDRNRLLIPTRTKGLYLYDIQKGELTQGLSSVALSSYLVDNNIYTSARIDENYFLLGSMKKGALLIDKQGKVIQQFEESNLLQDNLVLASISDFSKNIWLALSIGISKTELSPDLTYWDNHNGIKGNIYDITRFGKTIYIATNQQIYYLSNDEPIDLKGKNIAPNQTIKEVKNIPAGQNWNLFQFKIPSTSNRILLTGTQTGIYEISRNEARQLYKGSLHAFFIYQSISNPYRIYSTDGFTDFISLRYENGNWIKEGKWIGLNDDIRGIIEDSQGDLWLGTFTNGVIHVDVDESNITKPKRIKYYSKKDGLPSLNGCKPFLFANRIVFGTEQGLYIHNSATDRFEPFAEIGSQFCNGKLGVKKFC